MHFDNEDERRSYKVFDDSVDRRDGSFRTAAFVLAIEHRLSFVDEVCDIVVALVIFVALFVDRHIEQRRQ